MDITSWGLMDWVNNSVYLFQAIVALWGLYCVIVVWSRTGSLRFRNFDEQNQFLDALGEPIVRGDFDAAIQFCEGDQRAVCQMGILAMVNRRLGLAKAKALVMDTFQRDVLTDIEHRLVGVSMAIKTEPMLGLLGTVLGMMQAFGKLAGAESVKPEQLAEDISFALITTAVGLAVSIPYMFLMAKINVRIRKMEELVSAGISRFFDLFQQGLANAARRGP
ncbi:MAG: MotA/TolQ/ExbB proton channel family protein [Pirellulales bacterium]